MRRRIAVLGSLLAAGLLGASAAQAAKVSIGTASGNPGSTVTFDVTLGAEGTEVAGLQVDVAFDPSTPVMPRANGRPTCSVNPDINKPASSFAFRPANCTGAACTAVRAIILSTEDVDAIADGATLFTCTVAIAAGASGGAKPLTGTGAIFSTPTGGRVDGTADPGAITVGGGGETPTPEPTTPVACPTPRAAPAGPGVYIRDLNLDVGATTGQIQVFLASGGQQFAGLQNDFAFTDTIKVARRANGRPDCTINPDINKPASSFAFRPAACTVETCTGVRGIVLSTEDVDTIADGALLYTCNVEVTGGGTLAVSNVILSTPTGGRVDGTSNQDGIVCIAGGGGDPTPTPTEGPAACPTARTAPAGPGVWLKDITLAPGSTTGQIEAYLASGGQQFAGLQNDIAFASGVRIAARANGRPDCTINPAINKPASSFAFRPASCTGEACTGARGIVLSTEDVDVIPEGSLLYTCNLAVTGSGTLAVSNVILSTPTGGRVDGTSNQDGNVCVDGDVPPTATPTMVGPTVTPTSPPPTATVPVPPTNTVRATATATHTIRPPVTSTPSGLEDEGGCHISSSSTHGSGWMLLLPLAALLMIRRRSR